MLKAPNLSARAGGTSPAGPYAWFEVWANELQVFAARSDEVSFPPHLIILFGNEQGDRFEAYEIVDNRTWFVANTYAEAQSELWEDEYTLVIGRMAYD